MLAAVSVTNDLDAVNGDTSSITTLVADNGGDGISLREAVIAAASGDTVNFSPQFIANNGNFVTIQLSGNDDDVGGAIDINKSLTIEGPGSHQVIVKAFDPDPSGQNDGDGDRVFYINAPGLANVTISGLTITGGDVTGAGGAILNNENLTIRDSVITGNSARGGAGTGGAIWHFNGTLTIERTTISDNVASVIGGGVFADHANAVHVTESTVSGNEAVHGGGIYGSYSYNMNVVGSTISGNRATFAGGGVVLNYSTLSARHSTITANRADSDGNGSGSGGGVVVGGVNSFLSLNHTIVAGNFRNTGPGQNRSDIFGIVTAQFSLIGDDTNAIVTNVDGTSIVGTGLMPVHPSLGPLGPNGGRTQTHALLASSPAIDAGDAAIGSPPANDQRGAPFERIIDGDGANGARIDIGAYERQTLAGLSLVVDEVIDENDGDYSVGDLSLREAIGLANGNPGADVITFDPALYAIKTAKIFLTQGELLITGSLTINGPGSDNLLIDASRVDPTPYDRQGDGIRVFRIQDTTSFTPIEVELVGMDIRGGDVAGKGGAIYNFENLTITDCEIISNHAENGGGIHTEFGRLDIAGSRITGNTASGRGGGVCIYYGPGTVTDSIIEGNYAAGNGGGIITYNPLTITRSTITGNNAGSNGGGVSGRMLTIHESTITGNSATVGGGGIRANGSLTITRSTVHDNEAEDGGGILNVGTATISETSISENEATYGGGISHNDDNLTITASTITGNSAVKGGGLFNETNDGYTTSILNSTFSGNWGYVQGGGIYNSFGSLMIKHSTITNPNIGNPAGGVVARASMSEVEVGYSIISGDISGIDVRFVGPGVNPFVSLGYNLIGAGNAVPAFTNVGDQTGTDPMLGSLADNGGPTKTHMPLPGSLAIDAGPASPFGAPLSDQRGFPFIRVADGNGMGGPQLDIGAVERQSIANLTLVVDTLVDESDGNFSNGDLSLREAISLANGSAGANTITFASALTSAGPATILLSLGEMVIRDTLTLTGPGASLLTIDASASDPTPTENNGDGHRIFDFNVEDEGDPLLVFTLSGITLTGGDHHIEGGAINSNTNLVISHCVVTGNSAADGGGIAMDAGTLTMTNCRVVGNIAFDDGGGIFHDDGTAIVTASVIQGNTANDRGGGVAALENVEIISTTVSGNSAASGGGAFVQANLTGTEIARITNSTISGNTATGRGGGVYSQQGLTVVRFSTITDNNAPAGMGSGFASRGDALTRTEVHSSIIAGNDNSDVDFVNGGSNSFDSEGYNLVGTGSAAQSPVNAFNQTGDLVGEDPILGPLAENGGFSMTHALLPGSAAIDGGQPGVVAGTIGVPLHDQRGNPFGRVVDSVFSGSAIDIGAFERQSLPVTLPGDYNRDHSVDAADYVVWRKFFGTVGLPAYSSADGNGNTSVGAEDYPIWTTHFGESESGAGEAQGGSSSEGESSTAHVVSHSQPNLPSAPNTLSQASRQEGPADAVPRRESQSTGTRTLTTLRPISNQITDWTAGLDRAVNEDAFGQDIVRGRLSTNSHGTQADNTFEAWLLTLGTAIGEKVDIEFDLAEELSAPQSDSINESIDEFFAGLASV
jgi:CSLREA domain-containing protein